MTEAQPSGRRRLPQLRRAVISVEQAIQDARAAGTQRLPSLSALAAAAGVSRGTMLKAVHRLANEGKLDRRERGGTYVPEPWPGAPRFASMAGREDGRSRHALRVRERLCSDLLAGVFPEAAALPSHKELAERYGVSYRTLARELGRLAHEGVLSRRRRRYLPTHPTPGRNYGTVVAIASGQDDGSLRLPSSRTLDTLRAFERECARMGVAWRMLTCDAQTASLRSPAGKTSLRHLSTSASAVGYAFFASGIPPFVWHPLLQRMARHGKPIAVLEEFGGGPAPAGPTRMRAFSVANSAQCGRRVGEYLLRLGHRRIAYLSPFSDAPWDSQRLAGLRAACAAFGRPDALTAITRTSYGDTLASTRYAHRQREQIERFITTSLDLEHEGRRALRRVLPMLEFQLRSTLDQRALLEELRPLYSQALDCAGLTAWVGANDTVALLALDALHAAGRSVPADVSVVGFDDGPEAFVHGLTSYNFNIPAVVRAMLEFILDPSCVAARAEGDTVEISGVVVERRTSGRAA